MAGTSHDETFYILRNIRAVIEGIPYVYKVLIQWGCPKLSSESYLEFINKSNKTNREDRKWVMNNHSKLLHTDVRAIPDADATFLFAFIGKVCDKISKSGTNAQQNALQNPSSLENLLRITKDQRNDVVHEHSKLICSDIFFSIKSNLLALITTAGNVYGKSSDEVDKEIDAVTRKFDDFDCLMSKQIERLTFILESLTKRSRLQKKDAWERYFSNLGLPLDDNVTINRQAVLYNLQLSHEVQIHGSSPIRQTFSSFDIFQEVVAGIKIIQSPTGAGKSTFLKAIMESWLKISHVVIPGLEEFDWVIYHECKSNSITTFKELITKEIGCISLSDHEINEAVKLLKILILADGYDEMGNNSAILLSDIWETMKTAANINLIISSRSLVARDLFKDLHRRELTYKTVNVQPIQSETEKVKFIEKYENYFNGDQSSSNSTPRTIVDSFKNMAIEVKEIFNKPILLTLYCSLNEWNKATVREWRTEYHVLEAYYCMVQEQIRERAVDHLSQFRLVGANVETFVNNLMQQICKLSLKLLSRKCPSLTEQEFYDFFETCENHVLSTVNYKHILSTVINPKCLSPTEKRYEFFHNLVLEYFAARYICPEIKKIRHHVKTKRLKVLISTVFDEIFNYKDLYRFIIVVKYVILRYIDEGVLLEYLDDTIEFIKEVGAEYHLCTDLIYSIILHGGIGSHDAIKKLSLITKQEIFYWRYYTEAGEELKVSRKGWRVLNGRDMVATTHLLKYVKPKTLSIYIMPDATYTARQLSDLLEAVKTENFTGYLEVNLRTSRETFSPADDSIMLLEGARCKLRFFQGCIRSTEAMSILREQLIKLSVVVLSVSSPVYHNIELMNGGFVGLGVFVRYKEILGNDTILPIPRGVCGFGFPPALYLFEIPQDGLDNTELIIRSLAFSKRKFVRITLGKCWLSDEHLQLLINRLQKHGIRTEGFGMSQFYEHVEKSNWNCSVCTLQHQDPSMRCLSLSITDNSDSCTPRLKHRIIRWIYRNVLGGRLKNSAIGTA